MKVTIVGGGITGLFCAHYLMKDGHSVSVIEKSPTGSVTSIYNAGLLTPSLAPTPNIGIGRILSTYLGKKEAVYISPRQILRNQAWFRTALKKGLTGYEDKIIEMGRLSLELYEEFFSETGHRPDVIEGVVALYSSAEDARRAQLSWGGKLLDMASIVDMGFRGFRGGIMLEEEISINPLKLYKSLWDTVFTRSGAELVIAQDVRLAAEPGKREFASVFANGEKVECDIILLAAGSWSGELCKQLGYNPQILPARGLVILFDTGGRDIVTAPGLLEDYGIGLAQHNKMTLRLTGFFEMVGLQTGFSNARKKWLLDIFNKHVIKSDQVRIIEEGVGFRPCTPDQMPVIGLIPGYRNAYVASGNCRLGVTLAPATADVLRSMIRGKAQRARPSHPNQPTWYDPNRFL